MIGVLRSRKVLFGALILLLVGSAVTYFLFFRADSASEVLKSGAIQSDLAKGECSSETTTRLEVASKSSDAAERAKLYENQGLCFVYAGNLTSALEAYKLSKDAYTAAGLPDDAARLNGAIEGVTAASAPIPDQKTDDTDVMGGT